MAALLGFKSSSTSTSRHSLKKSANSDLVPHHQWRDEVSSKISTADNSSKLTVLPILEVEYSIPADATPTAICSPKLPSCLQSPIDSIGKSTTTKALTSSSANNETPTSASALKLTHSSSGQIVNQSDYSEPVAASRRHRSDSETSINSTQMTSTRGAISTAPKLGVLAAGSLSGNLRHHPQSAFEAVAKRKSPSRIATNPDLESLHLASSPSASAVSQHVEQGTYEEAWDLKLPRSHLHMVLGQKVRGLTAPVAQLEDMHLNSVDDGEEDDHEEEKDDDEVMPVFASPGTTSAIDQVSTAPPMVYDYAYGQAWANSVNYQRSHSESCAGLEPVLINNSTNKSQITQQQQPPLVSTQHSLRDTNQWDSVGHGQRIDKHQHQRSASCLAPSTAYATEQPFERKKERQSTGRSQRVSGVQLAGMPNDRRPRHSVGSLGTKCWTASEPLECQPWFHGCITRIEAEWSLARHRTGSFLVRRCESSPDDYSLSIKGEKTFLHMKIIRNSARHYVLGQYSQPYSSIPEMINHYSVFHLPIKGADQMILRKPVALLTEPTVFD